jgi:hypothetical protein
MKKITALLIILTFVLSGCAGNRIEIDNTIESVQSNVGAWMFNPIMEIDDGFYYSDIVGRNHQIGELGLQLRYYDKATGADIFLCAKPECQHDGSDFCPATGSGSAFQPVHTALYDGYLYINGFEQSGETMTAVLYRANPDGTALDRLAALVSVTGSQFMYYHDFRGAFVIHRGKLFVAFYAGNDFRGLVMFDLETLKHEIIVEASFDTHGAQWSPDNIKAAGDYLYYTLTVRTQHYIYRYNIFTGEHERVCNVMGFWTPYIVIGDEIWHSRSGSGTGMGGITIHNMTTGESRNFDGLALYAEANVIVDENGRVRKENFNGCDIMFDGEYLYVSSNNIFTAGYFQPNRTKRTHMFTLDGEHLAVFHYESCNSYFAQMNILNGKVYWQTPSRIDSCRVEDLISGNYEWTTELEFQNLYMTESYTEWVKIIDGG